MEDKARIPQKHNTGDSNFELHKYTLAFQYFKERNQSLRLALKNAEIFLNMVIHDLRNPTNQINFSLKYALERKLANFKQRS